jgi:LysR family hydrogen peroxide-inducible transcriptional activator
LTSKLAAGLKAGALDAALIALPYDTAGLETARVGDDELLAAAPLNHPLFAQATVAPEALEREDLILLEDGHCLREHALSACNLDNRATGDGGAFAATSLHTLVQMVGSGLGVSLLPAMAVAAGLADQAQIMVRPLADEAPQREIVVAWRAGSSREVEARLLAEALRGPLDPGRYSRN